RAAPDHPLSRAPARKLLSRLGAILQCHSCSKWCEAIANLTGVMKLDKGATVAEPSVGTEAAKAIWPVAVEVVIATALLGWAMLSMNPNSIVHLWGTRYSIREALNFRSEDMLRFIGEYFA